MLLRIYLSADYSVAIYSRGMNFVFWQHSRIMGWKYQVVSSSILLIWLIFEMANN